MAAYAAILFLEPYSKNPTLVNTIEHLPQELRDKLLVLHQYFMEYNISIYETISNKDHNMKEKHVEVSYANPRINFAKKLYTRKADFSSFEQKVFCLFLRYIAERTNKNDADILRQAAVFDDVALYKKIYFRSFQGKKNELFYIRNNARWAKLNESQAVLDFLRKEGIEIPKTNMKIKFGKCLYLKSIGYPQEKEGVLVYTQRRYEETNTVVSRVF
jgi:hypothetical protein